MVANIMIFSEFEIEPDRIWDKPIFAFYGKNVSALSSQFCILNRSFYDMKKIRKKKIYSADKS